ncbi:conserved hypothetical Ustilaginaceae-specific protein [Sporisorium reilianum SRZ2]|uniref:Conserved hypothetical Ustilaginaceae-specific protein n=1 Tax=Sporisorium reilianum (strain SRZ2) TaxID=999809 RepID=E7A0A1_SPORE|nr:conserved hypothetical Ustilaginaceae-specific protein [Sporisorium reilianum SRZ2]
MPASSLIVTMVILAIEVYCLNPPAMTKIVKAFAETSDLWAGVSNDWTLPGSHNPFTNSPPTHGWVTFLESKGADAINSSYRRVHREFHEVSSNIDRLGLNHGITRNTAFFLIKKYAAHLQMDLDNVRVYDALKDARLKAIGGMPALSPSPEAVQGGHLEDAFSRVAASSSSSGADRSVRPSASSSDFE